MSGVMNELEGKCTKSSKDLSSVESHLQDAQVQKCMLLVSNPMYHLFRNAKRLFVMHHLNINSYTDVSTAFIAFSVCPHHCRSCSRRRRVKSCPSQPG